MKQHPDFPSYFVTKNGRVWSHTSKRWLKPVSTGSHLQVVLCNKGKTQRKYVHRLVLETYVGLCPDGMECRHLNGDPADNRLENLKWGTRSENVRDAVTHGTCWVKDRCGEKHPTSKLFDKDRQLIFSSYHSGSCTQQKLANNFGVCQQTISCIVNNKQWQTEIK